MQVGIIGTGKLGTAVGLLLQRKGYKILGVAGRTPQRALDAALRLGVEVLDALSLSKQAELLLITTTDAMIGRVCEELQQSGGFFKGQTVMHMSGSLTTDVLEPARSRGCRLVSIHPLQACASVELALENLPGSIFSIQGDPEVQALAEQIVTDLGGQFFNIDKKTKPLYHAAACVASNYLVALLDLSRELMQAAGMPHELGAKAILPLVEGTLKNVTRLGTVRSLTGPIARGDLATLEEHLEVMQKEAFELVTPYLVLGQYTAQLAERGNKLTREQRLLFEKFFANQQFVSGALAQPLDLNDLQ